MTPSLQDLFLPGGPRSALYPPNSRYSGMAVLSHVTPSTPEDPDGRTIIYLERRFLPPADRFTLLTEHVVSAGERIDNITAQYLTDPEQYWRVCDANNIMRPAECEEPGLRLRITLPEGIPGTAVA